MATETDRIKTNEPDILSILRQLDEKKPQMKKPETDLDRTAKIEPQADPYVLRYSLRQKQKLLNLLEVEGYVEKKDIGKLKEDLDNALVELDEIIKKTN